ncbi:hypothetical protein [Sphingorhabdus lutea]|nr:hypothetical protein [Sphingorhabdus lutea]
MKPMRNVANKIFGAVAAGALALTPTATFAQEAPIPANLNTSAGTAVEVETPFVTFNDTDRSIRFVQSGAAEASRDKIAIVVFSGNRDLQREAYQAALQLRDERVPLALILGPSLDPTNSSASIQVYAEGVPVFDGTGAIIGSNNADMVQPETVRMARIAYDRHFPQRVASLDLAQN